MLNIDTTNKTEQRRFGVGMAVAFTVLAMLRWLIRGLALGAFPSWLLTAAAVFLVLGLAIPKALQPVFWAWLRLAEVLNWLMTRVMLTAIFYVIITPLGFAMRCFSEDPLKRKYLPKDASYWEAPEEQPKEFDAYRNQF